MERPSSNKSETTATKQNNRTSPTTQGINTNPIANVTEPSIIRASEIARNREAKAEGEETGDVVRYRDEREEEEEESKGLGKGGDRRI